MPLDELERKYVPLLEELHAKVLQGVVSLEESRVERFLRLFSQAGEDISLTTAEFCADCYQRAYRVARRPIPGAIPLLRRLRPHVKVAVVSNNLIDEQRKKLKCCGLGPFVDCLVVSEEVGTAKPDLAIFEEVLKRLRCGAQEAVMVGNSWEEDILGAHRAGMRAVWLQAMS
jgi:putative hydrolase of the HAD superfamily